MSGTSADGVDAAVVEIRGAPPDTFALLSTGLSVELLSFTFVPFDAEQRARIFALFDPATGTVDRICQMNFALGEWFAAAALRVIDKSGLSPGDVSLIGSHGQTIYHAVGADSPKVRATDRRGGGHRCADGHHHRSRIWLSLHPKRLAGSNLAQRSGPRCGRGLRRGDCAARTSWPP